MTVGEKLASARKALGFTQEKLANEIGVSFQAISTWERNESLPDTNHLMALSSTLHISLDQLFGEEIQRNWELRPHSFSAEHMYTYVKAKAQAEGLTQTLAALPLMRDKHKGQLRTARSAETPYATHPLTLACHALAMGITDDNVLAIRSNGNPTQLVPTRRNRMSLMSLMTDGKLDTAWICRQPRSAFLIVFKWIGAAGHTKSHQSRS